MKTYKTDIANGAGGSPIPVTVHYKILGVDDIDIESITAQVYVESLGHFVEGDITPFIDEYQYTGIQDEIWAMEDSL